ncbi:MAG TPA: hypothetical protein VMJ12_18765 [Candidatus Acidoferrales bacterium]|nr:hypothetical protein [Candidatus Acidoferrales bacterium]
MKTNAVAKVSLLAVMSLAMVLINGCATAPPVDWNSRVGHYSYAQAINELGPPNRQAHLSSGATELKWFVPAVGTIGTPNNNVNNGFNVVPNINPGGLSNRYLQLTFDTNGVLAAWSKNY